MVLKHTEQSCVILIEMDGLMGPVFDNVNVFSQTHEHILFLHINRITGQAKILISIQWQSSECIRGYRAQEIDRSNLLRYQESSVDNTIPSTEETSAVRTYQEALRSLYDAQFEMSLTCAI